MNRSDYQRYLDSDKWQRVRRAVFADAGGKCERCGRRAEQVHHLSYDRLGAERPEDTQALCARCHADVHGRDWPPVIASRVEVRDGQVFTVKVLAPAIRRARGKEAR